MLFKSIQEYHLIHLVIDIFLENAETQNTVFEKNLLKILQKTPFNFR